MTSWVNTWEDLPEGQWLSNDELGRTWFLDHQGNHWYSDSGGYRMYDVESTDAAQEVEPSPESEEPVVVESAAEDAIPRRNKFVFVGAGLIFLVVVASALFVFLGDDEEPAFREVIYWSDSGRGFSFNDEYAEMVYPNDGSGPFCEEWDTEYQNFYFRSAKELDEGRPVMLTDTCHSRMAYNEYELTYEGDDMFRMCMSNLGVAQCQDIHVFSDAIVIRHNYENICQILISNIEPSSITNRSLDMFSEVILNGEIRFDINDPWTNQFLQISRDTYNEAKSLDCFFPQYEYDGPRMVFESDSGEASQSTNDSLATVLVGQVQYTVDYRDVQFLLTTTVGQVECDLVGMESVENSSTGEVEIRESETSEAECIVQLYDTEGELEFWPHLSTDDMLVVKENGQQVCASSCLADLQVLHLGEYLYRVELEVNEA